VWPGWEVILGYCDIEEVDVAEEARHPPKADLSLVSSEELPRN